VPPAWFEIQLQPLMEQRPVKNRSFVLPESGPQVASGKDRLHILSDPLWR